MTLKVLLLEDLLDAGADIKSAIESTGDYQLIWGLGASDADARTIELIAPDQSENQYHQLSDFDIAFVDHELYGHFTGAELVELLRAAGVVTVGISAKANLNGDMLHAGANMTIPKHNLAQAIRYGEIDIVEVVETFCDSVGIGEDLSWL
ncbi:MAG: hypothetical protein Q8T09_00145 [Candidatus Melainabacteria bacterium]|nr:hypothetical protein [Candidatus Melainabacteria bacterium]